MAGAVAGSPMASRGLPRTSPEARCVSQNSGTIKDWAIPEDGRVTLLHMGGLGDLTLASEFVTRVKTSFPRVHLSLICHAEFSSIAELFPVAPDETLALPFNPYLRDCASPDLLRELAAIAASLEGRTTDLLLDGSLSTAWFTWFVAAVLPHRHAACSAGGGSSGLILNDVLDHFGLARPELERIETPPDMHEGLRYRSLAARLGVSTAASKRWSLSDAVRLLSRDWLERHGLSEGQYVACFPGVSGHADLRRWREANFVAVLDRLARERNLSAVLIGSTGEQPDLERIARMTSKPTAVFAGEPHDLALTAGLLALARAYLGNDSGPAHLAQALGVAGVVIFGGGGRPANYACWGAGSIGVLHPLPCFGCAWDCILDHGLCVDSVPLSAVADAMSRVLDARPGGPETITLDTADSRLKDMLGQVNSRYRRVQSDRDRRLAVIVEMRGRIAALEHIAAERLGMIEQIHAEAERRAQLIRELDQAVAERDRIAAERLALLEKVHAEAERQRQVIAELTDYPAPPAQSSAGIRATAQTSGPVPINPARGS
jgi:ADP-heptose:LPS heptosyltransferase